MQTKTKRASLGQLLLYCLPLIYRYNFKWQFAVPGARAGTILFNSEESTT